MSPVTNNAAASDGMGLYIDESTHTAIILLRPAAGAVPGGAGGADGSEGHGLIGGATPTRGAAAPRGPPKSKELIVLDRAPTDFFVV